MVKGCSQSASENFKLSEFRPNQLEAINSTLNRGKMLFVLIELEAERVLCYQLPAIIQRYKQRGVSIVVSPLLSLVHDQVTQLVNGRGIAAAFLKHANLGKRPALGFFQLGQNPPRCNSYT